VNLLSQGDLDRILMTIPSIADRGSLLSHLVKVGAYNYYTRPAKPVPFPQPAVSNETVVAAIRTWCEASYSPNSVRSKAISRLLEAIEEGDIKFGG